jgi:hypothetical protein
MAPGINGLLTHISQREKKKHWRRTRSIYSGDGILIDAAKSFFSKIRKLKEGTSSERRPGGIQTPSLMSCPVRTLIVPTLLKIVWPNPER